MDGKIKLARSVLWSRALMIATLSMLLSAASCPIQIATQTVTRAQNAANAAENIADAVQNSCSGSPDSAQANQSANTLRSDAGSILQASVDYERTAIIAEQATNTRLGYERARDAVAQLETARKTLFVTPRNPTDASLWQNFFGLANVQLPAPNPSLPESEFREFLTDLARATEALAKAMLNALDTIEALTRGTHKDIRDHAEFAQRDAQRLWAAAVGPLESISLNTSAHFKFAGEAIDRLNQHASKLAQGLADEKKAYADRDQAKANLQAALDKGKADAAQADALAQKCGAPPVSIRFPGYSETFWDISS